MHPKHIPVHAFLQDVYRQIAHNVQHLVKLAIHQYHSDGCSLLMVESGEQVYSIAVHLSSHRQEVASTAVGMTSY